MSGVPADVKTRILQAIAVHVRHYGRADWHHVREHRDFAPYIGKAAGAVGERRFFRWVNTVCEPLPEQKTDSFDGQAVNAAAINEAKKAAAVAAEKNLPVAPSPSYIARNGAPAAQSIDFLAMLHRIMADIEKLRGQSVIEDANDPDGWRIKNPHLFGQAIDKRLKTMDTALRVMQEIWDLRYQQRFYDEITAIIVDELVAYPEVQRRVIERLAALNARQGMTIYADMA